MNFYYDANKQQFIVTTIDGTKKKRVTVNQSSLTSDTYINKLLKQLGYNPKELGELNDMSNISKWTKQAESAKAEAIELIELAAGMSRLYEAAKLGDLIEATQDGVTVGDSGKSKEELLNLAYTWGYLDVFLGMPTNVFGKLLAFLYTDGSNVNDLLADLAVASDNPTSTPYNIIYGVDYNLDTTQE